MSKKTIRSEAEQDLRARLEEAAGSSKVRKQIPKSALIALRLAQMCAA